MLKCVIDEKLLQKAVEVLEDRESLFQGKGNRIEDRTPLFASEFAYFTILKVEIRHSIRDFT